MTEYIHYVKKKLEYTKVNRLHYADSLKVKFYNVNIK